MLHELFGDMYTLHTAILDPTVFGQCIERRRRYTILALHGVAMLERPFEDALSVLARDRAAGEYMFTDCMIASHRELQAELSWASARGSSLASKHGYSMGNPLLITEPHAYRRALVPWELKHLKKFEAKFPAARDCPSGRVYCLVTNCEERPHASKPEICMTQVRQQHMLWSCNGGSRPRSAFSSRAFPPSMWP